MTPRSRQAFEDKNADEKGRKNQGYKLDLRSVNADSGGDDVPRRRRAKRTTTMLTPRRST